MLSEREWQEMKAVAAAPAVREEFQRVKAASQIPLGQPVDLPTLLSFLTTMSSLCPTPPPRPEPLAYTRVLL
jgi:hypothetical protein